MKKIKLTFIAVLPLALFAKPRIDWFDMVTGTIYDISDRRTT